MNRNFGIGVLILCFGASSVNVALAAQIVNTSPIIVQPCDWSDLLEINQRTLEQDRIIRNQELAMEIHQTVIDASRRVSKYHDLIALTEYVDDMKSISPRPALKSNGIAELPPIIIQPNAVELSPVIVQSNTVELAPIIVQPNAVELAPVIVQPQADESIRWLKQVLAAAKNKAEYYQLTAQENLLSLQGIKARLGDKENQIAAMKTAMQSGQEAKEEVNSLKPQLAAAQDRADQLKQQLDGKIAQSDQMTLMIREYQQKLESKNNAYNEQWGQILSSRNDQARMEAQIANLNARLQEKEAQVVKIKRDMYDLQESMSAKDRDMQTQDLSLSMMQQKAMDERTSEYHGKINALQAANEKQMEEIRSLKTDLALARQELQGMPNSDEIDFLRTGFAAVSAQLKQKEAMLSQTKADADEYEKEFKKQSSEFQSLKEQLQNAYEEINHKNEDLKDKDLAIIRLKERAATREGDLQDQVRALARKLQDCGKP